MTYGPDADQWSPPPWGSRRRYAGDPNLRVSDAERTEIADALSKHYADGRLDDTEFKDRLDQAMAAKTRADLSGVLVDLPRLAPEAPPRPPRRPVLSFALLFLALGCVAAAIVGWNHASPHLPWVLLGLFVLVFVRRRSWHHHYRYHVHQDSRSAGPPPY